MSNINYLLPPLSDSKIKPDATLDWNTVQISPDDILIPKGSSGVYDVSYFPTPWARLYMAEYAFKKIAQHKTGNILTTEETKLINWTLDLLELVFFKEVYNVDLVFEDVAAFPVTNLFEKANKLFYDYDLPVLIKERLADNSCRLLGSTSPFCLVFPAYHRIHFSYPMGTDRILFDPNSNKILISERPKQFIQYLIYLSQTLNSKSTNSFKTFLISNFQNYSLDAEFISMVEAIEFDSANGSRKSLNIPQDDSKIDLLYIKREHFHLETEYKIQDSNSERRCIFISDKLLDKKNIFLNNNIKIATDKSTLLIHQRDILPGTIIKYDWLTESDFFADKVIKLPYQLDSASFQIGITDNNSASRKASFLLPLTDKYFQITGFSDNLAHDLSYSYDIIESYGKLSATVKIPLEGHPDGYLIKRDYQNNSESIIEFDVDENLWFISVFPNFIVEQNAEKEVKESKELTAIGGLDYYIEQFTAGGKPSFPIKTELEFYNGSCRVENKVEIRSKAVRLRNANLQSYNSLHNYAVSEPPRLIKYKIYFGVPARIHEGFVVPYFKKKEIFQDKNYPIKIAIDFGTSNSVVAIKGLTEEPKLLTFEKSNELLTIDRSLIKENEDAINIFEELSSKYFYNSRSLSNPLRSLICYSKEFKDYDPNVNFNIYTNKQDIDVDSDLNKICSEFKWKINDPEFENVAVNWVENYIANLLLLIKYELIAIGERTDYNTIQLAWFYPLAFSQHQKTTIRQIWPRIARKVFPLIQCDQEGKDESIAPFFDSSFAKADIPIMNIDIGGGTTDICIMKGIKQAIKLSMPLAGRNLIGDLYNKPKVPTNVNGLIKKRIGDDLHSKVGAHEGYILTLQKAKNQDDANTLIVQTFKESSIILWTFYYCILKYVKEVIDIYYPESESQYLYPHIIRFSGNGSRLIEALLQSEAGKEIHEELKNSRHSFNTLTNKVFETNRQISIEFNPSPKAATVLGSFKMPKDLETSTTNYSILGENILGYSHSTKLNEIALKSAIPEIKDSYFLKKFLPEFKSFVNSNIQLFTNLSNRKQIEVLTKYLDKTIQSNNTTSILGFIQGGITHSGLTNSQIDNSLFPFVMQGIINELTREDW